MFKQTTWIKALTQKEGQRNGGITEQTEEYLHVWLGLTTVGIALFSRASYLVAIFVHTPTLASAAMTLSWFEVALVSTTGNISAWRRAKKSRRK